MFFYFFAARLLRLCTFSSCLMSSNELCTALYTTGDNQVRSQAEQQLNQITSNPAYVTQARSIFGTATSVPGVREHAQGVARFEN